MRLRARFYGEYLSDARTFEAVTLERAVDAVEQETDAGWIRELRDRYLGWSKIERLLSE